MIAENAMILNTTKGKAVMGHPQREVLDVEAKIAERFG